MVFSMSLFAETFSSKQLQIQKNVWFENTFLRSQSKHAANSAMRFWRWAGTNFPF
jgi:hypothetical protein